MAVDPITAALDVGGKLIDRLWPDPTQRDHAYSPLACFDRISMLKCRFFGSSAKASEARA